MCGVGKALYPRLAAQNIRREAKFYLPYLLTLMGVTAAFYIVVSLSGGGNTPAMVRYTYLNMFLNIGIFVVALFAVVFLTYTATFLAKRRQRELGLYAILGMEKRHIGAVLGWETLYLLILGLAGGVLLGILLQAAASWGLCAAMHIPSYFSLAPSPSAMLACALLLGGILLFNLLLNLRRVHAQKPVELLRESSAGEKEPKTRWLLALLGIVTLGAGYAIAIRTRSALDAVAFYFLAVFLVIIGTYCLFTALSILILKVLRKNKGFYYQTSHFIGVSGMLHRMHRNAVGLANICILCTMVLVMVSGTLSLYLGSEQNLQKAFPGEAQVEAHYPLPDPQALDTDALGKTFETLAAQGGYQPRWVSGGSYCTLYAVGQEDGSYTDVRAVEGPSGSNVSFTLMSPRDYTAFTGLTVPDDGKVHLWGAGAPIEGSLTLHTGEEGGVLFSFPVGSPLPEAPELITALLYVSDNDYYAVLPQEDISALLAAREGETTAIFRGFWNLGGDSLTHGEFLEELQFSLLDQTLRPDGTTSLGNLNSLSIQSRGDYSEDYYGMNGGFFFLGVFLGLLFLMATVLIIYYKQLSEGYEDKSRYHIMVQVGLEPRDVKKSINSQMRVVFFAPLAVAAIHVAFDFPLVARLLTLFGVSNTWLVGLCTLGVLGAFCLVYLLVYKLTARSYYKIVG